MDGELIDAFLDLDASVQEEVVNGLGELKGTGGRGGKLEVEDIRGMVEGLRRLH